DRMLLAVAVNAGVEIHRVAASPQCRTDGRDGFVVLGHTETGRVILNAQWLVDATGRRAWLAWLAAMVFEGVQLITWWPWSALGGVHPGRIEPLSRRALPDGGTLRSFQIRKRSRPSSPMPI